MRVVLGNNPRNEFGHKIECIEGDHQRALSPYVTQNYIIATCKIAVSYTLHTYIYSAISYSSPETFPSRNQTPDDCEEGSFSESSIYMNCNSY